MSKLLINEPALQVLPSLAVAIGLQEAIVLQQIHFWTCNKPAEDDGHAWVFNSFEDWSRDNFPFWSAEACRKIFKSLRDQGLLLTKPRALHPFDKVQKYAVNYAVLGEIEDGMTRKSVPSHAVNFSASERENSPLLYTKNTKNTTETKEQAITPKGSIDRQNDEHQKTFQEFWQSYPKAKRVGKVAAEKAWKKIKKPSEALENIKKALAWQTKTEQWTADSGRFIPNPSTYLNQRRWEDEQQETPVSCGIDFSRMI